MKKVLILEDNVAMLEQLAVIVREIDIKATVYRADNVKDACQCAMKHTIDLFIIDIFP